MRGLPAAFIAWWCLVAGLATPGALAAAREEQSSRIVRLEEAIAPHKRLLVAEVPLGTPTHFSWDVHANSSSPQCVTRRTLPGGSYAAPSRPLPPAQHAPHRSLAPPLPSLTTNFEIRLPPDS